MRLLKFFSVLSLTIVLSACSTRVHIQQPISQPPLVEKEPVSVGVLYSDDLLVLALHHPIADLLWLADLSRHPHHKFVTADIYPSPGDVDVFSGDRVH